MGGEKEEQEKEKEWIGGMQGLGLLLHVPVRLWRRMVSAPLDAAAASGVVVVAAVVPWHRLDGPFEKVICGCGS